LQTSHPELRKSLTSIRDNLIAANEQIQQKEASIATLTKMLDSAQEQSKSRLLWIWKLTSVVLSLLLVVGIYLAWKIK
jgi:cytochrome c-type biogenesis protein CcmH/NrfG